MERTYRASNGLYIYVAFLALDALVLGWEALSRLRHAAPFAGALLLVLGLLCAAVALYLLMAWGRIAVAITHDTIILRGERPARRIAWADVDSVREVSGPAYQLSLRDLLPGPYLPHGLLRGETVLEIVARPAMRIVLRRALIEGYGALREDVLRSVPRDAEIDLHARWWRP